MCTTVGEDVAFTPTSSRGLVVTDLHLKIESLTLHNTFEITSSPELIQYFAKDQPTWMVIPLAP